MVARLANSEQRTIDAEVDYGYLLTRNAKLLDDFPGRRVPSKLQGLSWPLAAKTVRASILIEVRGSVRKQVERDKLSISW